MSTLDVSWLRTCSGAAVSLPRGSLTMRGTRIPSSYALAPLPRSPWEAPYSPWSEVKITTVLAATSGRLSSAASTRPMCTSTSFWSLTYRFRNSSHLWWAPGPWKGTGPNEVAAVACSERCRRGLRCAIIISGVSKFGGICRTVLPTVLSAGTLLLHAYHHAMSWGLTKETVAHHGPPPPSAASQWVNWLAIWGSTRQPWPGAPSGEGKVPPAKP